MSTQPNHLVRDAVRDCLTECLQNPVPLNVLSEFTKRLYSEGWLTADIHKVETIVVRILSHMMDQDAETSEPTPNCADANQQKKPRRPDD